MSDYCEEQVDKRFDYRRVIVICKMQNDQTKEESAAETKIIAQLNLVTNAIDTSIREFWNHLNMRLSRISIKVQPSYHNSNSLTDILQQENQLELIRSHVDLKKIINDVDNNFLVTNEISHLIGIRTGKDKQGNYGWIDDNGKAGVVVNLQDGYIKDLVHDIALDVSMFHTLSARGIIPKEDIDTVQGKIDFSQAKVAFLFRRNMTSTFYGPLLDNRVKYISFASLCRKYKGVLSKFDFIKYHKIWDEFIRDSYNKKIGGRAYIPGTDDEIINDICRYHAKAGQLSIKRIREELKEYGDPCGENYLLVSPGRRPKKLETRNQVAYLFGRKKWRRSFIKIIPAKDREKLSFLSTYLKYYSITR
jgi:hypothetical protein